MSSAFRRRRHGPAHRLRLSRRSRMNRTAIAILAGALLLLGAAGWWLVAGGASGSAGRGGSTGSGGADAAGHPAPTEARDARSPDSAAASPLATTPLPQGVRPPRPPEEEGSATVRGRLVDATTSSPLAAGKASLHHPQGL